LAERELLPTFEQKYTCHEHKNGPTPVAEGLNSAVIIERVGVGSTAPGEKQRGLSNAAKDSEGVSKTSPA